MIDRTGANIIKVADPEVGDYARSAYGEIEAAPSAYFLCVNRKMLSMLRSAFLASMHVATRAVSSCQLMLDSLSRSGSATPDGGGTMIACRVAHSELVGRHG